MKTWSVVTACVSLLGLGLIARLSITRAQNTRDARMRQKIVVTSDGPIRGHPFAASSAVEFAFLGIPFAQPPVGRNRWQPPLPPRSWGPTVLSADVHRPACIGNPTPGVRIEDMDEDCLYLDIYTPKCNHTASSLLPVMVFLHGGSLVEGSGISIQSGYGAVANVTRLQALSVAVNYRLAVLGFLALHSLAAVDSRGVGGNYGLLDCIAALSWIQKNIVAFGGDPARVVVYGQSSGGSLVLALTVSPLASGLFRSGISMSGSPRLNADFREAAFLHREVINRSRCRFWAHDDTPEPTPLRDHLFRCLQTLNKTELVNAMPRDWDSASFSFSAFSLNFRYTPLLVVDNESAIPLDYLSAYRAPPTKSPLAEGANLVIGVTREEIDFAPGDDVRGMTINQFRDFISNHMSQRFNRSFTEKVLSVYGLGNSIGSSTNSSRLSFQQTYAQIVSDATIFCPTLDLVSTKFSRIRNTSIESKFSKRELSLGNRLGHVYVYSTSQQPGQQSGFCPLKPFQSIRGYCPHYAFHAIDMFALFAPDWTLGNASQRYANTKADEAYGDLMARRFAEFAYTGAVRAWKTYDARLDMDDSYSVVDLRTPGESNVQKLRDVECSLWKGFYKELGLIN